MKGASTLARWVNSVVLLLVKGLVKKCLYGAENQGNSAVDGNDVTRGVKRRDKSRSKAYSYDLQGSRCCAFKC